MASRTVGRVAWDDVRQQATDFLSRYIQIDTSNPPGNEAEAARMISETLAADGIASELYTPAPGRPNLVARLHATDSFARPLLLLHHMDVVPANPGAWRVPPFGGEVREGYVWGRGAIDDKGLGTIHLIAFLLLARSGVTLGRDVILMAVADEEEGGGLGARWMVNNHWDDIECEYVWDEGGAGSHGIIGDSPVFSVSVWEKRSMVLRLTARGQGGHGAMAVGAPIDRLVSALHALQGYRADARFNDVTREFFRRVASTRPFPASWLMRNVGHFAVRPLLSARIQKIPVVNAMVRDTVVTTILDAGSKANVLPETAMATVNARLLPDTDPEAFLENIRNVVGESIDVEVEALTEASPPSPVASELFEAIERAAAAEVPGAVVTPIQTPFITDSRFFRLKGAKAYGLIPAILTTGDLNTIHGVNERISIDNLVRGIKITLDAITRLCARDRASASDQRL